jgi:hypothetical protein
VEFLPFFFSFLTVSRANRRDAKMEVEQPVARLHRVPHAYVSMSINLIFFILLLDRFDYPKKIVYYIFLDTDNIFEIIYSNILVQFQLIISCVYLPLLLMCMPSFLWPWASVAMFHIAGRGINSICAHVNDVLMPMMQSNPEWELLWPRHATQWT